MNHLDEDWLASLTPGARDGVSTPGRDVFRQVLIDYAREEGLTVAEKAALFERVRQRAQPLPRRTWYLPTAAAASIAVLGLGLIISRSLQLPDVSDDYWAQPQYRDLAADQEPPLPVVAIDRMALKRFLHEQGLPYRISQDGGRRQAEIFVGAQPAPEVLGFLAGQGLEPDPYGWLRFELED
jgi:hypothetical protein